MLPKVKVELNKMVSFGIMKKWRSPLHGLIKWQSSLKRNVWIQGITKQLNEHIILYPQLMKWLQTWVEQNSFVQSGFCMLLLDGASSKLHFSNTLGKVFILKNTFWFKFSTRSFPCSDFRLNELKMLLHFKIISLYGVIHKNQWETHCI